jgi:hypothetical protein
VGPSRPGTGFQEAGSLEWALVGLVQVSRRQSLVSRP